MRVIWGTGVICRYYSVIPRVFLDYGNPHSYLGRSSNFKFIAYALRKEYRLVPVRRDPMSSVAIYMTRKRSSGLLVHYDLNVQLPQNERLRPAWWDQKTDVRLGGTVNRKICISATIKAFTMVLGMWHSTSGRRNRSSQMSEGSFSTNRHRF